MGMKLPRPYPGSTFRTENRQTETLSEGTEFVHKADSSLHFYLFLQLIAPRVMFSARLHHSAFDIFVNKSAQSTLCQTCSLGLSLAPMNTYLFLGAYVKLFDFCAGCFQHFCLIYWIQRSKQESIICLARAYVYVFHQQNIVPMNKAVASTRERFYFALIYYNEWIINNY